MRNFALDLDRKLGKLMPIITPLGVLLGFLFPSALIGFKPLVPALFALMTLSGSIKLRGRDLAVAATSPVPVIGFFLASHVLMPFLALLVSGLLLPGDHEAAAGFVLLFSAPTAVSGFVWVSIFKGDGALGLALLLLDTIAAPFVMPGAVSLFTGASVAIDGIGMALSLGWMVVIPTAVGVVANELSKGAASRNVGPYVSPVSKILIVLVVAANSAAVAPGVDLTSKRAQLVALSAIILTSLGFLFGRWTGFLPRVRREQGRTLVFSIAMRNISAAATIAIAFFPPAAALPSVLGMVFQQTLAAVFGRLLLGRELKGLEEGGETPPPGDSR